MLIMDSGNTESNSNLVDACEDILDSKSTTNSLKEVILTVPTTSPVIVNYPHSLPLGSPVAHLSIHRPSCTGPVCRICHEDETAEQLISPCECSGSLGLVHTSCIEKWLSSSNTTICEICKYKFSLTRKPKSLYQWLHSPNANNGPSGFYGDVVCLVLLTPLCVVSVYLCAVGAKVYINHGLWEGTGLALLCCFLMGVYILWCFVTVRFHWKRLRRWQAVNQSVRLLQKFRRQPKETVKTLLNPPQTRFGGLEGGVSNPAADCEAS